ncbi:protein-export chaperone SecB [Parvularcula marina]|uniref:protein-export chaperone SecB n=1 Tax=Parvularcula marina TaxID=2292771 RepID=UPI0035179A73
MSETPPNDQQPTSDQPVMRAMSQYLKDLSFESPGAPQSLMSNLPAPEVEVGVDVNARRVGPDQYEVELACNATSTRDGETVFVVETNYAGLFLIQNVPDDQMEPLLLVEAPRLLFPFARQIVASATKEGGFPPLMLEPLDFAGMYRMQRARAAEAAMPNGNA